jgi:hypothetical protein
LSAIAHNAAKSRLVTVSPTDSLSEESSTANLPRTMGCPRSGLSAGSFHEGWTVGLGVGLLVGGGISASSYGHQPLPQSPGAMGISLFFVLTARWTKQRRRAGRVLRPRQPIPRSPGAMGISLFFGLTARGTKQYRRAEGVLVPPSRVVNKIGSAYALSGFSLGLVSGRTKPHHRCLGAGPKQSEALRPVRFFPYIVFLRSNQTTPTPSTSGGPVKNWQRLRPVWCSPYFCLRSNQTTPPTLGGPAKNQ